MFQNEKGAECNQVGFGINIFNELVKIQGVPGLQKVSTAGTGGTGKQCNLRGSSVYFLHIFLYISEGKFTIYSCCGTGKKIYFAALPSTGSKTFFREN